LDKDPIEGHWRAADEMIRLFGPDAGLRAALRADKALEEGDTEGFRFWQKVEAALRPRAAETQN
jgi:hypothetical protein